MVATDAGTNGTRDQDEWDRAGLPNFFILGAAKAGTTTLAAMLAAHPQVYIPKAKELGYFNWHEAYERGLDDYRRTHFAGASGHSARGDATPSYLCSPEAPDRAALALPCGSRRFIIMLRDPVDRAYSHYLHMRRAGAEAADFSTAVDEDDARVAADTEGIYNLCYVYGSRYGRHIARWRAAFPDGRFLVLFLDDLRTDPDEVSRRVAAFLDLDPTIAMTVPHENAGGESRFGVMARMMRAPAWMKRAWDRVLTPNNKVRLGMLIDRLDRRPAAADPIDAELQRRLRASFAEDTDYVEELTGRDLSSWRAS